MIRIVALLAVTILISACHPGGYTDAGWAALTPEQREFETEKQAALFARYEQKREEKRAKAQADAMRKSDQSPDYQLPAPPPSAYSGIIGDRITCVIPSPLVDLHPGWTSMKATAFTLARGQTETVGFLTQGNQRQGSISASYTADGLTVKLCRFADGTKDNDCDAMTASLLEFARGAGRSLTMPDTLQGTLECRLVP